MGKRKERRKAAMASGRRYKLDLFADPSGDLSGQEGASDKLNNSGETGVPSSPTSGKENPLTLLSQYTDEDSDEEEMERSSDVTREGSVPNSQIAESTAESDKAGSSLQEIPPGTSILQEITPGNSILQEMALGTSEDLKHRSDNTENVSKEVEATGTEHITSENKITHSFSGEPVMQTVSDVGGDWKAVIHAETNQFYYWNTVTGETSWEVPADLVSTIPNEVASGDDSTIIDSGREASELAELVTLPLECQMAGLENTDLPAKNFDAATEDDKGVNGGTTFAEDFDPDKLVKYGEDLLERLKLLDGSSTQIEKIREEIAIRISDCKELKPYGMSLFPFWLHTQSKLRDLEASIYNTEVSLSKSTPDKIVEEAIRETTATLSSLGNSNQMAINEGEENEIEMEKEKEEKEMEKGQEEKEQGMEEVREKETILLIEDVDMEIEEETIMTNVTNTNSELALTSLEEGEVPPPSPLPHDWVPPPPPSEDKPVPPPPLDEPVPPPPLDEPVPPPPEESSVSYSVLGTIPPYQNYMAAPTYNYSAPSGGYTQPHYYDPYYTASAQVASPFSGAVVQAVSVTNGVVEPTVYNYAVPMGQGAAEHSTKPEDNISVYHTVSYVGTTNGISVSSAGQAVGSVLVAGDPSVSRSSAVASSVSASSAATPSVIVSSSADYSAAATSVTASSVATPSTAAMSSVAPPVSSKDQSKVSKSKKRSIAVAPTLRSNKKVASLVNKWNAAKEERDNDDDEPESAYEALERKRQKAIEEWRLHQIASGEAENNANFVPLGGDWRERVKRKRAKKAKIGVSHESSSDATTAVNADIKNEQQQGQEQPDLGQLSIGLPSGWQAYWDESSKQVYYGNALTSETSWIRPV